MTFYGLIVVFVGDIKRYDDAVDAASPRESVEEGSDDSSMLAVSHHEELERVKGEREQNLGQLHDVSRQLEDSKRLNEVCIYAFKCRYR